MKIMEIIPQLSSGGGERFTVDLCNELAERGHDITLVVLYKMDGTTAFYKNELLPTIHIVEMNKRMGFDWRLFFNLRKLIRELKPDIVHTHLRAVMYSLFSILLNRSVVYCHTVHNAACKEAGDRVGTFVRKVFFKYGWIIPVTISPDSHRSFVEFYGFGAPMIANGRNIPKSISVSPSIKREIEGYRRTSKTRILVQLARMEEVKRHSLMAHVVKRLVDEGFDVAILMIGRKNEVIVEKINQMNCSAIHLLGERHNPLDYLIEADAYCLCSNYEGMPISLIEALGTSTVPICTPVGGIVNVIEDGVNGFLSKDLMEESYYKALRRFVLLDDKSLEIMKKNAHNSYAPYNMIECGAKYQNLFYSLLHNSFR